MDEASTRPLVNASEDVRLDELTDRVDPLEYQCVFIPCLAPFKRNNARDEIRPDGSLHVADSRIREIRVGSQEKDTTPRDLFQFTVAVEFDLGTPIPFPSVAPNMRFLRLDPEGDGTEVFVWKDGADNFYLSANTRGRVSLRGVVDAPRSYFSPSLERLTPLPKGFKGVRPLGIHTLKDAKRMAEIIGILPGEEPAELLRKSVGYFRSFTQDPLEEKRSKESLMLRIVREKRGVCRHRSIAFLALAKSLGFQARYVSNEAHVFVEVALKKEGENAEWTRIDLGGGGDALSIRGPQETTPGVETPVDPFPRPPEYLPADTESADHTAQENPRANHEILAGREPLGELWENDPSESALFRFQEGSSPNFPGEAFFVLLHVESPSGAPMAAFPVEIALLTSGGHATVLGIEETDAMGTLQKTFVLPGTLPIGDYQLVARRAKN